MTSLSWFRSIILYSFVGNSGPRKVLLKGSAHASQQHDWICSLGTHTEPTPAENTRHCLSVHFPIHCASQSAHCHHHLPQSHTFCPHVLLSHLLGLHTCLLHICHYPQNDHWPAVPEENHLLGWLFDSDVFGALPWEDQILTVMAYDHYVAICKPLHYTTIIRQGLSQLLVVVAAWTGGILHATVQILLTVDLTFCGSKVIDHFMCDFFCVATCLQRHLLVGNGGGSSLSGDAFTDFFFFFSCSSSPA